MRWIAAAFSTIALALSSGCSGSDIMRSVASCTSDQSQAECAHRVTVRVRGAVEVAADHPRSYESLSGQVEERALVYGGKVKDRSSKLRHITLQFPNADMANAFIVDVKTLPFVSYANFMQDGGLE